MTDLSTLDPFTRVASLSKDQSKDQLELFDNPEEKSAWDNLFGKSFMRELFVVEKFDAEKSAELFSGNVDELLGQIEMWMWSLVGHSGTAPEQPCLFGNFDAAHNGNRVESDSQITCMARVDLISVLGRALDTVKIITPETHAEFIQLFPIYNRVFNGFAENKLCQDYCSN